MTGNRFDYTAYDDGTESIYDRKKDKYYYDMQLSKIEELMNELAEENQALKRDKTNLHRTMSKDRVRYNQFKDNVFYCIDKNIKLFKDCYMSNEAKILEDLRKELSE